MRCTYREMRELGRSLAVVLLLGHAAVAAWAAKGALTLPIEAGGLVLGPLLGLPLLFLACWLVAAAVLLLRRHPSNVPALAVAVVLAFDGCALVSAAA